jgi:hypothetical protein
MYNAVLLSQPFVSLSADSDTKGCDSNTALYILYNIYKTNIFLSCQEEAVNHGHLYRISMRLYHPLSLAFKPKTFYFLKKT